MDERSQSPKDNYRARRCRRHRVWFHLFWSLVQKALEYLRRLVTAFNVPCLDQITGIIADELHYNPSVSELIFNIVHVRWIGEINGGSCSSSSRVLILRL